ncbi:MAG: AbrB/MazE/SpoVT family DNA-binding domain-containing protein [Nanoarchaeota archaeon]|jgi:delta-aminolevulinic acid dehydratase/porphobilinogen synthase|nr:AbrB/MazE/SpoVT family DNA-binding domain-containing protein [Nanoarchaeota archaeon]
MEAKIKKWGNSYGIILPRELIKEKDLKENDKIDFLIVKEKPNLEEIYGSLKGKIKKSSQKLKDEARKGWN